MSLGAAVDAHDAQCMFDLSNGMIAGERDYMSSLFAYIRRHCLSTGTGYVAQILHQEAEQRLGCDAMLLVRGRLGDKLLLVEAKSMRSVWDGGTKSSLSHFQDQLVRQSQVAGPVAVVEAFIPHPRGRGQPFLLDTVSCIDHNVALGFGSSLRRPWTEQDVVALLANGRPVSLGQVVDDVAACRRGQVLSTKEDHGWLRISLPANLGEEPLVLPSRIDSESVGWQADAHGSLRSIMATWGLRFFGLLDGRRSH